MITRFLSMLAAIVVVISAGTSCNSVKQPSLFDSGWVLEKVNNGKEPLPKIPIHFIFSHDRIGGFAGCNGIAAQLQTTIVDNGSLKLDIFRTLVGCDYGKFEEEYIKVLDRVAHYETDGKTLSLFDESGQLLLTYRRDDKYLIPPPTPTTFINIPCTDPNRPNHNC